MLPILLVGMALPLPAQGQDWPRRVLITNDDGIDDPGLLALARVFAPVAETYVVAPMGNRSGSASYLSAISRGELEVQKRDLGEGVTAYAVDGYPADAVTFGLTALLAENPPDLVISGINSGPNLTDDAYLSGTIGAARIAALLGVRAMAVSGHNGEPETLAALAAWVAQLASSPVIRQLESRQYLTVSIPRVPATEIEGVDVAIRGPRTWKLGFRPSEETASQANRELWAFSISRQEAETPDGADTHSYRANRIAIVPMRVDEQDYKLLEQLQKDGSQIPDWPPSGGSR
jgi:5'-nucleotidase